MQIRCSNCFFEYDKEYGLCPNCGYAEGEEYAEAYCLSPGTKLTDRYIIGETLGVGGFGITYKAWDVQLETVLAIKEYFPSSLVNRNSDSPELFLVANKREQEFILGKQRFLDEARNMAKFSKHHNIVNVFNYFEANNTIYIVMEYLDGVTLSQALQLENGPLSVDRCASIAIDVCDALESIHMENILHRDVSPDNIMLCNNGTVKLFDFGAARFACDAAEDSKVTVIVKPGFAPYEQYNNINQQDARTDLYALGATLYYAMTGVKPDESTDRKIRDTLRRPSTIVAGIPEYMDNAIMRAMSVEPQFRFDNIEEFRKIIQQKIQVPGPVEERNKKIRKRMLGIGAAALAVVAAAGMFLFGWQKKQDASVLPDGSIELWYIATGDETKDEAIAASWKSITDTFMEEFANVTVTTVGIDGEEYVEKLAQAQKNGSMPELYESTDLPSSLLSEAQSLEELLSEGEDVLFLNGLNGSEIQYPTSIEIPAIYVNTSIGPVREAKSIDQMLDACDDFGSTLTGSKDTEELYEMLYDANLDEYVADDALNQFLTGKCMMYLGTTSDYQAVQEGLIGKGMGMYTVLFPETGKAGYDYGCLWSCNEQDEDSMKISMAFLEYLTSDLGQDHLCIRNFAYTGCIPVSRSAIERYMESYEELAGLENYLKLSDQN